MEEEPFIPTKFVHKYSGKQKKKYSEGIKVKGYLNIT